MDSQLAAQIMRVLQTTGIAAVVFAAWIFVPRLQHRYYMSRLPTVNAGAAYATTAGKIYKDAYKKFKDQAFTLVNDQGKENVIIPMRFLPEIRNLGDDVLSFSKGISDEMEIQYTKLVAESHTVTDTVKTRLTSALPRLHTSIADDVKLAFQIFLPPCDDWTEVNINEKLVPIIAKVSGSVFVGPEISSHPDYLDAACMYPVDLFNVVTAVKNINPWLKPFLAPRTPEVLTLRKREQQAKNVLRPIIEQRIAAKAKDPQWKEPEDVLQWIINRGNGKISIDDIVSGQLTLIFAAIHTTSTTVTNTMFTLVSKPEYIKPLQEEIRQAIAEEGGVTYRAVQKMEKLDSFMKEVLRFHGPSLTGMLRRVLKGITLSNGQYIPPGVMIEIASQAIYHDDQFYPNPEVFDGFRSYKARQSGKAADIARNQFITTNEENLTFGHGRHACPGRFFAALEIKMIIARFLLDYDIKMPNGQTERHPQIEMGRISIPFPAGQLLFKKKTTA
ncbi:ent-kaurene oxidase [Bipolaris maydis]|nr:ent-kaurene oxidase [Bipolaris maydis]